MGRKYSTNPEGILECDPGFRCPGFRTSAAPDTLMHRLWQKSVISPHQTRQLPVRHQDPLMNDRMMNTVFFIVLACVIAGGYYYWHAHQPNPHPADVFRSPAVVPTPPPKPQVRQVIESPQKPSPSAPPAPPIPKLDHSDSYLLDALANLINDKTLQKLLIPKHLIRNIVATIDNLPRKKAPIRVMPVVTVSSQFQVNGSGQSLFISPHNAARYTPYVKLAEAINSKNLVELYVRLYPLFQQAYQELGFPNKYFNDRLIETINDLLATPSVEEPIPLVVHSVYYQYADPDLEALSSGQRILLRIGKNNATRIKAKLRDIKQELLKHMHEEEVKPAR